MVVGSLVRLCGRSCTRGLFDGSSARGTIEPAILYVDELGRKDSSDSRIDPCEFSHGLLPLFFLRLLTDLDRKGCQLHCRPRARPSTRCGSLTERIYIL